MAPHKTNLVALGSAAVIAVYSAGYVRTRSAAEAMESQSAELRPKLPPLEASPVAAPVAAVALSAAPKETTVVIVDLQKKLEHPHRKRKAQGDDSAHRPEHSEPMIAMAIVDSTSKDTVKDAPAAPVIVPPAAPTPDSAKTATQDTTAKAPKWKDGAFHGYGTSRHGDIEAEVEIRNGRIISAKVSQCLTRYSCSWIDPLLPEVVERQTYDVDYVSGATQSSDAFRYAVWEALSRAK